MTTKELLERIEDLSNALDKSGGFLTVLHRMADRFSSILIELSDVVGETTSSVDPKLPLLNRLHASMVDARAEIEDCSLKETFESVYRLRSAIELVSSKQNIEVVRGGDHVMHQLEIFTETYERYVKKSNTSNILLLLLAGDRALRSLDALSSILLLLKTAAVPQHELSEGEQALSIFLPGEMPLDEVAAKIEAVRVLYEEICELYTISTSQFPLKVLKIEGGSLWVWATGSNGALKVLSELVTRSAGYVYRNYTREGKLNQIRFETKVVKDVLQMHMQLGKSGIDVDAQRHHLEKAGVAISKKLVILLSGDDSIEIDGESLPLTPAGRQKLLAEKKRLALPLRVEQEHEKH